MYEYCIEFWLVGSVSKYSGALYGKVPNEVLALTVSRLSSNCLAWPKSPITKFDPFINILFGFKSRWIIFLECKYSIPINICLLYIFIVFEWNGSFISLLCFINFDNVLCFF